MDNTSENKKDKHKDEKNWLEWLVFSVCLTLVLAILGYLVYKTYTHQPTPPDLVIHSKFDPAPNAPNRYHVQLDNKGGTTAEEVIVELSLIKDGEQLEHAQLEIPFAPQASQREGWVGFRSAPAASDSVVTRVVSYKKP